jgi:hypothetical protein
VVIDTNRMTDKGDNLLQIEPRGAPLFACGGDSGSVVVNNVNEVVGVLRSIIAVPNQSNPDHWDGLASPIQAVRDNLPIDHLVTGDELRDPYVVPGPLPPFASSQPPVFSAEALQRVLGVSREAVPSISANPLVAFYLNHGAEVFALIRTNPRVAVAWMRGDGPALARLLLRAAHEPDRGQTGAILALCSPENLDRVHSALMRYGSRELRNDLRTLHQALRNEPGAVYVDLVNRIRRAR